MSNKSGKQIVGFRRVRGRVIPISGHIAGNAGVASVAVGAIGLYLDKSARKALKNVRAVNRDLVGGKKLAADLSSKLQHSKLLKDMSTGDFLMSRNSIVKMTEKINTRMVGNKQFARLAIREIRSAAKWKKTSLGLGAISLGAMAYQKLSKKN